jgi:predicted acetyltransferase
MKENLRLIKPIDSLENEYLDMLLEWKQSGEELIPWSLNLDTTNFHLMIESLNGYSKGIGLPDGFVECSTYWLVNKSNKILGAIDIRHRLNDFLLFRGGHIGYGIRPKERRKGYSSLMLSLALKQCKTIGISKVLITCLKNNIGSVKTITKNQGILESEDIDNGEFFQRYWINLK